MLLCSKYIMFGVPNFEPRLQAKSLRGLSLTECISFSCLFAFCILVKGLPFYLGTRLVFALSNLQCFFFQRNFLTTPYSILYAFALSILLTSFFSLFYLS